MLVLLALVLGALLGNIWLVVLFTLFMYFATHLYWLYRLERWLARERRAVPPDAPGIWGDVFHHLYRHYRGNRKRKQRIAGLMSAFRDSTGAMPDGAIILNSQWQIAWFNDAARRLLGLAKQDIGQRIANLLRNPVFINYLEKRNFSEPVEIVSPLDDEQHLSLQIVSYGDGEHLLLVRDTTRLFRLEQMRREFVANASHELRSPLTVIAGYLEAMNDDVQVREHWQAPVSEMRRQTERMSGIVADLLELSRLETAEPNVVGEEIDVRGVLARVREAALAIGEGPGDIELDFRSDARLRGVEREIYSAFSNLVFNAMRYTPPGGSVTVTWEIAGRNGVMSVSDTGIGIPAEHIPRLTERFYRVDAGRVRSKGGTGLGLAIVKHVLQRHGARLEVSSTPGRGSTFACVFPASRIVAR
ncbi:MAG: phosphate regulon sensor histidine kinase PhoR [Proteobacteria bacterium]|nr:phosphate regulon sensor histidine kinase PhoR [Pseudomonadota bacterium]